MLESAAMADRPTDMGPTTDKPLRSPAEYTCWQIVEVDSTEERRLHGEVTVQHVTVRGVGVVGRLKR